jgi:transcriptional regulator with XRE-family HTH domain
MPRPATADPTIGARIRARRMLRGWSVRYAASRAGLSHATWSRIERGLQAADNRFVLADIASALECASIDLTGTALPAADREAMSAQLRVHAIRRALVDLDLSDTRAAPVRPGSRLERDTALVRDLYERCDYAGASRLLPDLLTELHAATGVDRERRRSLEMLYDVTVIASCIMRQIGHPAEAWLGAERCRTIAEVRDDPILVAHSGFVRAVSALACGSHERCIRLAHQSADALRPHLGAPGGTEVLGMLRLVSSYGHRGLKQSEESAALTVEAADLAERTGETTTLGMFFGPTNVSFWRVAIETDGGDVGRAIELINATNPSAIGAAVRTVYFYTDAARAYASVGGNERDAVRLLLVAERVAPQHVHSSVLVRETARSILERSYRSKGEAALRGLCERLGMRA